VTESIRSSGDRRAQAGRRLPVRAYVGALIVLFGLTALASTLFVGGLEDQNAIQAAHDDAQYGASLAASDVSTALAQLQATVTRTAAVPGLGAVFDRADCTLTVGQVGPFANVRLDLVRPDGSVLCSSAATPTASSQAGAIWLKDPAAATALAAPAEDPRTKRLSAVSAAPVPGRGLVVAFADLTGLGPALSSRFSGPQALEFLVATEDGRTVIGRSSDPERWIGASLDATPFGRATDPVARPDVSGVPRIYGRATVASAGWTVYAGMDRDVALAPARDLFRQHAAITLGGMAVLLLGTLLVYRTITAPLWRLSDAMGRGTSGLVVGPVAASGPAEIARMAFQFNELVATARAEIAETARAEADAHASERKYRVLFAGNPQPLFVYDIDTLAFLEVNDAAIRRYGYTRDEFREVTVADIVAPDQPPFLAEMRGHPDLYHSGPRKHRSKDGAAIDVQLTSIRLAYDGHDARLVVVEDLTERTKLTAQLQQSQRLETVGQLAGGIAHDFNNLLAVILNYADFVAEELPAGNLRHDVEEIQRAASRAADLTRQLLIFARREVANPQVLDLNAVIGGVENMLRRTIGEDIELALSLADDLPCVRVDTGQIEQVFLNLTVNARDAMPGGGRLVVETSAVGLHDENDAGRPHLPPGPYVRLSVSDTGTGMSEQVAARALEPFFTTKKAGQGTGLGLATVYGIVAEAGGNIAIESQLGVGTRVSIHLPVVDEPATPTIRPAAAPVIRAGKGRTVLIVEDEKAVLLAAVRILTGNGYRVSAHSDSNDALRVLADPAVPVAILVTDVVMPSLSGVELADRARELRPGLPVLLMSGYSEELVAVRGTLPAGSRVMQKPVTRRNLLEAVGEILGTDGKGG
jgi:two-component system cell cycle sensor histidine kinase/response regulator CckA